ncbi:MAG TPA: phenylalanine--tRNA ligase subunit beta, partial [Candidatus Aenigmarchaeota archaeon]|nr:phenylalanine--tRNA ligase subunit beta [Candidatus Aenigmarchaeota archaeon]
MPVITVNKDYFCKLLGKDLPMDFIEERLPMLGVGWEEKKKNEFSIEVFPNRPDMLSVEGLARAFASFIGLKPGLKEYKALDSEYLVTIDPKVNEVRPYFVAAVVKNVEFTDDLIKSVIQLQEKLHITHGRKRRKVAIGLHDLEKIYFPVTYTTKPADFRFVPLEQEKEMSLKQILEELPKGKEYGWILEGKKEYPILIDNRGVVLSMPPIINSEATKVEEGTKNLFIDITATDLKAANEVLNILVTSFADIGCEIYKVKLKYANTLITTPNLEPKSFELDPKYVNRMLGLELSMDDIIKLLEAMGHAALRINDKIEVKVPCYRCDIMHPIDLVEDIAIAYGYEKFEPIIPNISTLGKEDEFEEFSEKLRNFLTGFGLQEVVTFILTNKEKLFKKMNMPPVDVAETLNPKTEEYCVVRNWLLPSLIEILARNKRYEYPQNLFEVGDVFHLDEKSDTGVKKERRLAVVLCHAKASLSEIKSVTESILLNLGIRDYKIEEDKCPCFIEGRSAIVKVKGENVGRFGEVHPIV